MKSVAAVPLVAFVLLSPLSDARAEEPRPPLPQGDPARDGLAPDCLEKMHARLRRIVDEGRSSGYVSLLARDGKIADWRSYGQRDREAGAARRLPIGIPRATGVRVNFAPAA